MGSGSCHFRKCTLKLSTGNFILGILSLVPVRDSLANQGVNSKENLYLYIVERNIHLITFLSSVVTWLL